jgi:uncharacterized protein (TIGR00251 family)
MSLRKLNLHDGNRGAALAVRVTPRARKNEISEIMSDGTVKIRVTAPPVDGKANEALIEFLADVLDVSPKKIEIVAGATGRNKLVSILGLDADDVQRKILAQVRG